LIAGLLGRPPGWFTERLPGRGEKVLSGEDLGAVLQRNGRRHVGGIQIRVEHLLGHLQSKGTVREQDIGDLLRPCQEMLVVDHLGYQTDALGFVGADPACGEDQIRRSGSAENLGERVADPDVASPEAQLDELRAEHRGGGGDPEIAGRGDAESAADGRAVDGSDHRLRQCHDLRHERRDELLGPHGRRRAGAAAGRGGDGRLGKVETRTESAARAGEDHHPAVGCSQVVKCCVQLAKHLHAERVEPVGIVERDDRELRRRLRSENEGHVRNVKLSA
jgi:hypothetical protein